MKKLLLRCFNEEIPVLDEKWRRWCRYIIAIFAVHFACIVTVDALFNDNIMLGPGLVDTGMSAFAWAMRTIEPLLEEKQFLFLAVFLPGVVACLLVNALVVYKGFNDYEKWRGEPYPLQVFVTFFLLNAALVGMLIAMLACCGIAAWTLGLDYNDGAEIVRHMTAFSHAVVDRVPTLVELPYPLPLIAAMIVVDFFFYWFHRWGHTLRLWWLLWHRPHHMMPALIIPVTQPVFAAAPLFLFFSVPFQIIVGVLAKIFGPDTMIMEALLLRLVTHTLGIFSHNSAYYEWYARSKLRMFLGELFGVGNYHYMHHSALPGHEAINISGTPYFLWDKVFGTFVEPHKEKPPVGLTGSPELHMNPIRLAFSGIAQIVYELKHNKGFITRCKILFGSTNWSPPITKDYAIKYGQSEQAQNTYATNITEVALKI